ncbi:hypothetical protein F511_08730 [Dorcoceras hygrometricum]|uniref:Uncharacterized protein n=1 Tax=Dorcoceras hygrometricum TaxID=472368 RepID=A0A2Z7A3D9_9LAMI|nr:hypothetical protein F511_08730 [Dorcoceras hygrometricum]
MILSIPFSKALVDWKSECEGDTMCHRFVFRPIVLPFKWCFRLPNSNRALLSSHTKLKSVKNHLPKAVKEQKNYWSTIAKTYEHYNNFALLKSGDSSLQTVKTTAKVNSPTSSDLIAKAEVSQIWPHLSLTSANANSDLISKQTRVSMGEEYQSRVIGMKIGNIRSDLQTNTRFYYQNDVALTYQKDVASESDLTTDPANTPQILVTSEIIKPHRSTQHR